MKPTLNGFIGEELSQDKWPSLPIRTCANRNTMGVTTYPLKTDKEDSIVET